MGVRIGCSVLGISYFFAAYVRPESVFAINPDAQ